MLVTNLIDVASLAGLSNPPPVLLDCRFDLTAPAAGRAAYLQAHIPGARFVDLNEQLAGPVAADTGRHPLPSRSELARLFASLCIDRDTRVVVYDAANGSLAARAWWLLRWLGHARVAVLDGGFNAWVADGQPVEAGEPGAGQPGAGLPGAGNPAPPPDAAAGDTTAGAPAIANAAEVEAALRDPARRLIDARAAERYAGRVEPIDPVAGHVPGALNHPFTANLTPDGRFLPAAELRRRWLERLGGAAPGDSIMMCGSGVTACHNLLALELAGLPGAKLYPGSWSEWIRDPGRPVARGDDP